MLRGSSYSASNGQTVPKSKLNGQSSPTSGPYKPLVLHEERLANGVVKKGSSSGSTTPNHPGHCATCGQKLPLASGEPSPTLTVIETNGVEEDGANSKAVIVVEPSSSVLGQALILPRIVFSWSKAAFFIIFAPFLPKKQGLLLH
ncbi:hypothetical protein FRC02_012106 [Tulasnella sp. 418]|nr:hypothetical protein FRC02_012106 [Tulasnella sp. 418]